MRCRSDSGAIVIAVGDGAGAVGLPGEGSELVADLIGFAEEYSRKKLEIEAHLSDPFGRKGRVKVDQDPERAALGLHPDRIAEPQVGIGHRVESPVVLAEVGIAHVHADLLRGAIDLPRAHDGRRLPLARGRLQTQVPIGRDAHPVLDDAHAALVALRIIVMRQHDVEPRHLEVLLIVDRE